MAAKLKELSIVIPCYNEAARIGNTLDEIVKFCKKNVTKYEVIVVDDGSKDNTVMIAKNIYSKVKILKNKNNRGKGYTVKRGMLEAKYEYVLFTDADNATPIKFVNDLMKHTKLFPVVIGSRNLPQSRIVIEQPPMRQFMGRIFSDIVRYVLCLPIKDTQCGFKLFRKDVIRPIFSRQTVDRFAFDVEIMYIAHLLGHYIKEVPIYWYNEENSKVDPISDSVDMFLAVIKILWRTREYY